MKTLVTGGTGFIGQKLIPMLLQRTSVICVTRNQARARQTFGGDAAPDELSFLEWDPQEAEIDLSSCGPLASCYHLAGETVAARWNERHKREIRESRVAGTRNLVASLEKLEQRPATLINASAVGYYGAGNGEKLDEDSPVGDDFLAEVAQAWEAEASRAEEIGIRTVLLRTGLVLGTTGGLLETILPIFRLGFGGRLGSGEQYMPWIHIDDVVGLMRFAEESSDLSGPINLTAPNPVTNREFTQALAQALHRPAAFPVPRFALKLRYGEFADYTLMSQRVVPKRAQAAGYQFRFETIKAAFEDLVG